MKSQRQVNSSVEQWQRHFGGDAASPLPRCRSCKLPEANWVGPGNLLRQHTLESMENRPMNANVIKTGAKKAVRELKSLRTADYKKALERHRCCRCCRCCRGG
jgi:hypothetical protein